MDKLEVGNEKGETVSVSQEQKQKLLTTVGEQAVAGLKYIMCMAEATIVGLRTCWSQIHHVQGDRGADSPEWPA